MQIEFLGGTTDFFDSAFYNTDADPFDPTILSTSQTAIVIENPRTGFETTLIGTNLPLNPAVSLSGTLTGVQFRDASGNLIAEITGFSWSFPAFVSGVQNALENDDESDLNALLSLQPINVDASTSTDFFDFEFPGVTSQVTILGPQADSRLEGGDANDTITPIGGSVDYTYQRLTATPGNDTFNLSQVAPLAFTDLDYTDLNGPVTVTINALTNSGTVQKGADGVDTIVDPNRAMLGDGLGIIGSASGDIINVTPPAYGFISLDPYRGNDTMNVDLSQNGSVVRINYSWGSAVDVNLQTGVVADNGRGGADTINVTGTGGRLEILGSHFTDNILGSGRDERFILLEGNDFLDALGGWDLLRYDRSGVGAINADLDTNTITGTWYGNAFTHTVFNVEEIRGSRDGDDVIAGSEADERFEGRGGDDSLVGRGGNDTLRGDDGNDTLRGGDGRDDLRGGTGDDLLDASGGSAATQGYGDYIRPGLGNDQVIGHAGHWAIGGGADLSYADLDGFGGVTIVSGPDGTGTVTGAGGQVNDTFTYIDFFQGSMDSDTITGSDDDRWEGFVGLAGNDIIDGGAGYSRVSYDGEHFYSGGGQQGINATLATGIVIDTFGDTDTLINIDEIHGSVLDDVIDARGSATSWDLHGFGGNDAIYGSSHDDFLDGGTGNDTLLGGDGNDTITDGSGLDSIDGGEGIDLFTRDYEGSFTFVPVIDLTQGRIYAQSQPGNFETILNVENISTQGAHHHKVFGSSVANHITTGPGDDTIEGRGGADSLVSNEGNDILVGDSRGLYHLEESAQVYRLYDTVFGREPDSGGHHSWTLALLGGATLAQAASAFVASPEFQATYGSATDAEFVTLLYQNVLNRPPSETNRDFWVGRLEANWSRTDVVLFFSESTEHVNQTAAAQDLFDETRDITNWGDEVYRLYGAIFDREPEAGGFNTWTAGLAGGTVTLTQVTETFMTSTEFQTKYGSTTTADFVTLLYQNVLDRTPSQGEIDYWSGRIDGGLERARVVLFFAESPENVGNTRDDMVTWMQTRFPDDVLDPGAGDAVVSGGAYADTFVFTDDGIASEVIVTDVEAWDWLDFSSFGLNAQQVLGAMAQDGEDVVFTSGAETIVFADTQLSLITEDMILV